MKKKYKNKTFEYDFNKWLNISYISAWIYISEEQPNAPPSASDAPAAEQNLASMLPYTVMYSMYVCARHRTTWAAM